MRKSLIESFDRIYVLDLHGNAKKKEKAPDGSKDENIFDSICKYASRSTQKRYPLRYKLCLSIVYERGW